MARKVVLITDPGIDGAYAVALALFDPDLDVLALAATAGNVSAEQATKNVHILVEQLDPPKWPRIGAALPIEYPSNGTHLHGPGGLGGVDWPCARLHHPHQADKLIVDMVHDNPGDVSIIVLGPCTALAAAMDRESNLPELVRKIIVVGGVWHEPGNETAVTEFHFHCDPLAARQVLHSGAAVTMVPLDVMRKALFSPTELARFPPGWSQAALFLRKITPFGVGATARKYAIEGFHMKDVMGVAMATVPEAFKTQPMTVDVETAGELTRGMSVIDERLDRKPANVEFATDVDMKAVRNYLWRAFSRLADEEE